MSKNQIHEIFGTKFYFTDASLLGYGIIWVPLTLLLVWMIYKVILRHCKSKLSRLGGSLVLIIVFLSIPFWEVVSIGFQAKKICAEQAGLHVYKTVEVDGFISAGGIKYWSQYGYKYIESGGGKYMNRKTMVNGKVVREPVTEFISRYGMVTVNDISISPSFRRTRYIVRDRQTDNVLGELTTISIKLSWFDRKVLLMLGNNGVSPWSCGDEAPEGEGNYSPYERYYYYNSNDVIRAVLKPKKTIKGEGK